MYGSPTTLSKSIEYCQYTLGIHPYIRSDVFKTEASSSRTAARLISYPSLTSASLIPFQSRDTSYSSSLKSTVNNTPPLVLTATTPLLTRLLVLNRPPTTVSQSLTSHSSPSVLIVTFPASGKIPMCFPSRLVVSILSRTCILCTPAGSKNVMAEVVRR